ncbi:50S ribosomal protein L16 [Synechococcus sp. Nb3U1]|uniref:50S ribosomal protein L16 n=1 Tax=Synechococcus sp. Nb3U1 TaxID=1914529 RepID=UPI001F397049|nr:50S ribosomal protein L16 [Synechococcus sp. Nb3U1]MCF2971996.1 50S ribosomal protein L16 [Synechococcus sp. Nb3U1]
MLSPKRTKYRKQQRGRMKGKATRGNRINFGEYALVATEPCWITARQIEASRRAMNRYIRRGGQIWIRIFPDKPVTQRAAETRMGSGKGNPEFWVCVVKPGRILFEMGGVTEPIAREAMRLAAQKMPIKVKFVTKADFAEEESSKGAATELAATAQGE